MMISYKNTVLEMNIIYNVFTIILNFKCNHALFRLTAHVNLAEFEIRDILKERAIFKDYLFNFFLI